MSEKRTNPVSNAANASTPAVLAVALAHEHEAPDLAGLDDFSAWLEAELAGLEKKFASFCTHDSLRGALGR